IASISKLLEISQKYKPDQLRAVGTRVFREALNAPSYIEEVKQKTSVDIDVISGEMEAEYSFNGSLYNLDIDMQTVMVVDIGGGSTEISFHSSNGTLLHYSMPVGAVTITENYLNTIPAYALEYDRARDFIFNELKSNFPGQPQNIGNIVFSSGTPTLTSAVLLKLEEYNPAIIHGSKFTLNELKAFEEIIKKTDLEHRKEILKLDPEVADIYAAGLLVLLMITEYFKFDSIVVSDTGARFGVVMEMLS
ncbi:MAG: hypothetical protein GY855_08360, partial [candidate division Zixibacteria bacterium]|nr:hypothetical protein [candidate division Zixibacteria bacterium]